MAFVPDERDPCLFVNAELDMCIGVHVDEVLAVGPSELTKTLLQELSNDMTISYFPNCRWYRTVVGKRP